MYNALFLYITLIFFQPLVIVRIPYEAGAINEQKID